ncbi:MAG TPA: cyclic nucleotide-binding domain-containing protein [Thermoanaerobaculia bacterium]
MVFKKLFGGEREAAPDEASTIEDLIVLERYDEAVERLKARLKLQPNDLHGHLRLAEAYAGQKEYVKAVDEYVYVAEEYAQDGFYDRGIALLMKARRFAPLDGSLEEKIERLRVAKDSERSRSLVLEGLREGRTTEGTTTALLVERLWHKVAPSPLVRNLPPEVLKRLVSVMELVTLSKDALLAEAGSSEPRLYFILDGVVRARVPGQDGDRATLRDFTSGDVIGESVLLERRPWPARYEVAEAGKALALGREGLEKLLQGNPDPRGFLTALRGQHKDREVAKSLAQLTGARA